MAVLPSARYLARRLPGLLPTLLVPVLGVFVLIRLAPGDPARQILGDQATPAQVAALRSQLGLDQSLLAQFTGFLRDLATLNLGQSLVQDRSVSELIPGYALVTLEVGMLSLVLAVVLGGAVGLVAGFRRQHLDGRIAAAIGAVSISVPQFWFGLLLIVLLAVQLPWFPVNGYQPWSAGAWPHLHSLMLPALALAPAHLGLISRTVGAAVEDAVHEPFVLAARAQGIRPARIQSVYVLRVAAVQILTISGILLATVLSGSVVIENVFGLPGMGRLLFDSVGRRDYPVIQGVVLFTGLFVILINLMVDLLYAVADPRVQLQGAR